MSATPRPWEGQLAQVWGANEVILRATEQADPVTTWDNVELTVRAVNAFDALLAVAKAASRVAENAERVYQDHLGERKETEEEYQYGFRAGVVAALGNSGCGGLLGEIERTLDAAHPDWREWA